MSKSHWILVAFVATMVCNGSCRPREVDVKNIYPVYRSEKQLEHETPNRYEKSYEGNDDSISYHRIDIPYKTVNGNNTVGELAVKNNSKSVVDYVPVALTIKKPNIKVWPSDQNGIQSPDDLSLYNIYTNNINPLNIHHVTTPDYNQFHYTTHSKPSIFILEELTTRRPFYDYDSVYTQPIQVLERPPAPPPLHVYYPPQSTAPPLTHRPVYRPSEQPPTTEEPSTTQTTTTAPTETTIAPTQASKPETTTKKRKKVQTRCPNVSITATSVINNSNSIEKEGCQDINIHINADVTNSNSGQKVPNKPSNTVIVVTSRPTSPGVVITNYPTNTNPGVVVSNYPTTTTPTVVVVQHEPTTQTGLGFGIFDLIWSIFSRIFNFAFFHQISGGPSTLSTLFAGLSAFFLPWIFPHLLFYGLRSRRLDRFVPVGSEPDPVDLFDFQQKNLRGLGSGPRKKISRYK